MSGFFGTTADFDCIGDVFYGTDYHSHLGTKRAGVSVYSNQKGYQRAIHSLEDGNFRNKFEKDIVDFEGKSGIGIISDTEAQPLVIYSHLGKFSLCTVSKINNVNELAEHFLSENKIFSETSQGGFNPTEVIAMLICEKESFVEGIENVYNSIKGSCSMLILHEDRIIAARDKMGRTPIIIGKKDGALCVGSETCSCSSLEYDIAKYIGPAAIVDGRSSGYSVRRLSNKQRQG